MTEKKILFVIGILSLAMSALAQKPILDTSVLYHWPKVEDGFLSGNGRYAVFTILEEPKDKKTLVLKDLKSDWEKRWINAAKLVFTRDSRQAIIQLNDSLMLIQLETRREIVLPRVTSFKMFNRDNVEYMAWLTRGINSHLVIRSIENGKEDTVRNVVDWIAAPDGKHLLLKRINDGEQQVASMEWPADNEVILWEGQSTITNWLFDSRGDRAAFILKRNNGKKEIWYYSENESKAKELVNESSPGIESGMAINNLTSFSQDGNRLLFWLQEKPRIKADPALVSVDIWSYRDAKLQSQQLVEANSSSKKYLASVPLNTAANVVQAQLRGERLSTPQKLDGAYLIVDSMAGDRSENYWSSDAQWRYHIIDMASGKRTEITKYALSISPLGRYLLLSEKGNLLTYEFITGITRPITRMMTLPPKSKMLDDLSAKDDRGIRVLGWLEKDDRIIISDSYDVWELDPLNHRKPINLTAGYGALHSTVFDLAFEYRNKVINDDSLVLSAFNKKNKYNGFFKIKLHRKQQPVRLTMGPYFYYSSRIMPLVGQPVFKAIDTTIFIVERQSEKQSPNFFWTSNFKNFIPISSIYPENKYLWLKNKLVNFTRDDGKIEQGIIYFPQSLGQRDRCPVILHYYEERSDELHKYCFPEGPNGDLNIPWFVSHGYGVFIPDIHFTIGQTGQSVLKTINGAVRALRAIPQVDPTRLALQGHSYGGWSTMYLLTHSRHFVAGVASSGDYDLISEYTSLWGGGNSKQGWTEIGQGRMGVPPWKDPIRYIRNSPIFAADKISAPVLMVSNRDDHNVSFSQGLEMFASLRRLGKAAWMLQYDNEGHGLDGKPLMDYLLRQTQFFDYYLKRFPAPIWMTQGISAAQKGLTLGFELDIKHPNPGPGLLISQLKKEKNKKRLMKNKSNRF